MTQMPTVQSCKTCGKSFPWFDGKFFCSKTCRRVFNGSREITCPGCGKIFIARGKLSSRKHCSHACKKIAKGVVARHCVICGVITPNRRFCSRACVAVNTRNNRKTVCLECSKVFFPRNYPLAKFCSNACKGKAHKKNGHRAANGPRLLNCKQCGNQFKAYGPAPREFCSMTCRQHGYPPIEKTCAQCSKHFTVAHKDKAKYTFCSRQCYFDSRKQREATCAICGKLFFPQRGGKFCSQACWAARRRQDWTTHKCEFCGNTFTRRPYVTRLVYPVRYCSKECQKLDPKHTGRLLAWHAQTRLEISGYAMLDEEGIVYERQYPIKRYFIDAFVVSSRLAIEFDGDYWHGNSAVFSTLDSIQETAWKRDRVRDAYLTKAGYRIIRIWESDLYNRPDEVRRRLREALAIPVPTEDAACNNDS